MNTKPLKDSLPDEHILQVEPRPKPSVETGWRSRPNLYTGRALSEEALAAEQRERSGRLALRGQMVSPGVVAGLEVRLETEEPGGEQEPVLYLHISPGMGLTASGEDVVLNRLHRVLLRKIPAYRQGSLGTVGFDVSVLYSKFDDDAKVEATHRNLQAAVLVLVPVVSRKDHSTDTREPVELDPENEAFEDRRLVDGCALVLFAWPEAEEWKLPARDTPRDKALWRNRLAWKIFNHEQQRPPGQYAPWEEIGVPLALVGFEKPPEEDEDPDPTPPIFIDRAAVVRTGGAPRGRTPLLESRGSPLLWQARSLQFAEHFSTRSTEELSTPSPSDPFEFLPPLGTLPKDSIDLFTWQYRFFPPGFILDALPVPLEQLDAVAQASASLAPLRASEPERVRILVPVPEAHFEPHLLREELLDPAFPQAISSSLLRLGEYLKRRKDLRSKATVLSDALDGVKPEHGYPTTDPAAVLGEKESSAPLNPQEAAYETEAGKIPTLDKLFPKQIQTGTWQPTVLLGFSASEVSTAVMENAQGRHFGLVTRHEDALFRTIFHKGTGTWEPWENVQAGTDTPFHHIKEYRALWDGDELVIVALVCVPPPAPPDPTSRSLATASTKTIDPSLDIYITIGRSNAGTWTWDESAHHEVSSVSAFTAVCWSPGRIDAFVATSTTTIETTTTASGGATAATATTTTTTTTSTSTTVNEVLRFTWLNGAGRQPEVESLVEARGKHVFSMVALSSEDTPSAGMDHGNCRIELLFLGNDPPTKEGEPRPTPVLNHLSGVHEFQKPDAYSASLTERGFTSVNSTRGHFLSACWTLNKTEEGKRLRQFDVLVMGPGGISHAWYNESWKSGVVQVSKTFGDALVAESEGDGQVHAFWWKEFAGVDSPRPMPRTLFYSRFQNNVWSTPLAVQPSAEFPSLLQPFGVVLNGTTAIDLFLTSPTGLQHKKMVAESKNERLSKLGLRGIILQNRQLLNQINDFISGGSSQLQADTQNVRQLMISGSTESSRLVVSPILGATMVQSPLAARSDIESYLSHFLRKRTDGVSTAPDKLNSEEDARETLQQAVSTRRDLTERLINFVDELKLDMTDMAVMGVANIDESGKVEFSSGGATGATGIERASFPLKELVDNPSQRTSVLDRIEQEPDAIVAALQADARLKWTTSDYFSTAVHHLENTLVLLQELERRMDAPTLLVEEYEALRDKLEAALAALQERLGRVEGEVAEARQDVTVGRALLAEELARIQAINQRREDIFTRHVPFLVFQRPRESDLTRDTLQRVLDPGLGKDLLPQVLASTAAAPPELLAYTELVRDSPLKWFNLAPGLLRGLDRIDLIQRTFEWAYTRTLQRRPIQLPLIPGRTAPRYAQGLSRLMSSREELLTRGRLSYFQYFQPSILYTRTWLELQQSAHEQLSLGDLIDTAQGRPEVSRNAATELEHITKVATGLYQRFGEVLPAIRLEWAEQMSQYDEDVKLHDLSRLPRWGQIEITDRREMQRLVDWLFQRVVHTQSEALSLMNDLVRVCLLLASHAPVNELLSGHVTKPATAKVGGTLELAVDPARVRVGMHVMIRSGGQTVQAVVEDLSSGVVRARVLSASAATVRLQEKDTVHFSEPGRGTGTLLPYVGTRR